MKRCHRRFVPFAVKCVAIAAVGAALRISPADAAQVTLDPATRHQTILGWGAVSPYQSVPLDVPVAQRDLVVDIAVNELGLTRLLYGPPGGNGSGEHDKHWEWFNDDDDPEHIVWSAFNTARVNERVTQWILPIKQAVEKRGDQFSFWVCPAFPNTGSMGEAPTWLLQSPGEFSEYLLAFLLWLKNTHGLTADGAAIMNEPANQNSFYAPVLARIIKALGPRLLAEGLPTKIVFPNCEYADQSWNFIQAVQNDAEIWPYVGMLAYHLYGTNTARPQIRDFGLARGLPTAMTEFLWLDINYLYDDLTLGGVSEWNIFGMGQCFSINLDGTSITRNNEKHWTFRQVMNYVRPGAVRIEATSDDSGLRTLAFDRNGKTTVVLINGSGARTVAVGPLPAGTYGTCRTRTGSGPYEETGTQTLASTGTLSLTVPADYVATIYPHPGVNQPPVMTGWNASPSFLTLPASSVNLSAAATDPELNAVTWAWQVALKPASASVMLSTPGAAATQATGMGVAGEYVFTVTASDATTSTRRDVRVIVHATNEPPSAYDVHNRIPVILTLPNTTTNLRAALQDLEGDTLTKRWRIASQPVGANADITSPGRTGTEVTNMTVPGNYVFELTTSDATHSVVTSLTVPVYPVNNNAPVITNALATPARVEARHSATLSATTSDPDGDLISNWWETKSAPAGARPVFDHPGHAVTLVGGLSAPGAYTFMLTVVDRTKHVTKDATLNVDPATTPTPSVTPPWRHY